MIASQGAAAPTSMDSLHAAGITHRVVRVCMQCRDVLGIERWPGAGETRETTGLCAPCCQSLIANVEAAPAAARCA